MVTAWRDRLVAFDGFGHLAPHRLRVRHGASRTFDDEVEGRRMLQRALYAREAMLEECKKVTRESLTDWAFGKDFAFMLQLVLSAVCSCMNQLCVTHVAQEYNGTRNIFLCGVKFFVRGQSQDHNQDEEDLKWSQRRVPQDEVEYRAAACFACHRGREEGGAGGSAKTCNTVNECKVRC